MLLIYLSVIHDWLLIHRESLVDVSRLQDSQVFFTGSMLYEKLLHEFSRYEDKSFFIQSAF